MNCRNGKDDDKNGYIEYILRGWDFYNNDNNPDDDDSHGTHCAGTIEELEITAKEWLVFAGMFPWWASNFLVKTEVIFQTLLNQSPMQLRLESI